jgi:hypothetical protein
MYPLQTLRSNLCHDVTNRHDRGAIIWLSQLIEDICSDKNCALITFAKHRLVPGKPLQAIVYPVRQDWATPKQGNFDGKSEKDQQANISHPYLKLRISLQVIKPTYAR